MKGLSDINTAMSAEKSRSKRRILIISHDKIGTQMAGPGMRYHYIAEVLSKSFDVTVGFFNTTYLPDKNFTISYEAKHIDAYHFESGFEGYDVVLALWLSESMMNYCNQNDIFIVFDVYAPVPVESLASYLYSGKKIVPENDFEYKQSLIMYHKFFENGDLFLYSNQRQLDYWTGYVFGTGQVKLSTYNDRPFFDRFIYAPMGIDSHTPLIKKKPVMRGVLPGVTDDDKIMVWTGGIWGWYDGKVLMRAMSRLAKKRPDIKLVFFGTQHPNPDIPEMKESFETRKLAEELGLTNKTVFFMDGWVDFPDRIDYLIEADVAINTHKPSIETEFSHRTRVLDHIYAELPTIGTTGDYLSDMVISEQDLGITVPPNDEVALEAAIVEILKPATYQRIQTNITAVRADFDWNVTLKALHDFLLDDPVRLERLPTERRLRDRSAVRLAKRVTPVFAKKIIIRTLRYVR
jgi:glycosyltransferase involved in cell wall biosynthesis